MVIEHFYAGQTKIYPTTLIHIEVITWASV